MPEYVPLKIATFSLQLVQRDCWKVFPKLLAFPPCPGLTELVYACEPITIKHAADITRRFVWERIEREEGVHVARTLQQSKDERDEPRIFPWHFQSSKPHLPVQPGLMRCAPAGRA